MVQLSHSYMITGKTITLVRWTFVGKVMSLLFNMLSRLVIIFFQEYASFSFMAVITIYSNLGAKNIKSNTVSTVFPSICREEMGPEAMILAF